MEYSIQAAVCLVRLPGNDGSVARETATPRASQRSVRRQVSIFTSVAQQGSQVLMACACGWKGNITPNPGAVPVPIRLRNADLEADAALDVA